MRCWSIERHFSWENFLKFRVAFLWRKTFNGTSKLFQFSEIYTYTNTRLSRSASTVRSQSNHSVHNDFSGRSKPHSQRIAVVYGDQLSIWTTATKSLFHLARRSSSLPIEKAFTSFRSTSDSTSGRLQALRAFWKRLCTLYILEMIARPGAHMRLCVDTRTTAHDLRRRQDGWPALACSLALSLSLSLSLSGYLARSETI